MVAFLVCLCTEPGDERRRERTRDSACHIHACTFPVQRPAVGDRVLWEGPDLDSDQRATVFAEMRLESSLNFASPSVCRRRLTRL
jgi:hypothetical protein